MAKFVTVRDLKNPFTIWQEMDKFAKGDPPWSKSAKGNQLFDNECARGLSLV